MDDYKICTFFGHRTIENNDELRESTRAEIARAVEYGCRSFYFGGYGEFDGLCYEIVSALKKQNSELGLRLVYCVPQERYLRKDVRYFDREKYDEVIYLEPSFEGWYKSIYFRNCAMIDAADYCIFYAEERSNSGAYKAYKYAVKRKNKRIVNLFK